ncbi:A-kinase anchor protein 9 isoform X10 [Colius striatus]|uniref:A-kinase anchor protein 9 isoform X10 n=1 Tax=Colius striatus TaxID=57412 RepID=UPI002B1CF4A4|nr:A-kinase anchor protein 9 isoform X10 [Colius striatus]
MEDEERLKKLEAGKAKLAQFRQRKAQTDSQNGSKKQKNKKKMANVKDEESIQDGVDTGRSQGDETSMCSSQWGAAATADFAITRTLHSGEIIKHSQTCTIELESEIFNPVEDYSSEDEELGVGEICSEHGMQHSHMQLEVMENELVGKQQEIEELNRELEEMRAAYGTEGLQQLQEFEAAIKKRDDIITQLTTNLQQARKEKDETMREFLELTEQSQKLKIQFQHLQASEALRNTSHSCTAADLLQAKQQILSHQQQLEEQESLLKIYQKKIEEFEVHLQDKVTTYEMEKQKNEGEHLGKLQEKEALVEELEAKLGEEEKNSFQLKEKLSDVSKLCEELKEQISLKNHEISNMRVELTTYKQKERQCSDEIKQLMGTVEELQKQCYKDSQSEADIVQRMELETQRRLAQLQAELDEMYGQQIVQMKQELVKQHAIEIEQCLLQQKLELEKTSCLCLNENVNKDQVHLMNIKINELNMKLQDADNEREKIKQELTQQMEVIEAEKSLQQSKIESLLQELNFSREQVQRAKQTIVDMECKLNEAEKYQFVIEDLKTQLASASDFRKELELKHEAEVTNYKIKLEMLEREKDAVLDRMAESQEAELERLTTKLLFSHEEELSRLKEDLQKEHMVNMESLKDNLNMQHKQQLDDIQSEMSQKIEAMQYEKNNLIANQNQLILEISNLKDLQQSIVNSKSEEMTLQIHELQSEIEVLRQKEKGTLEQEIQELQLKTELMQEKMREREEHLQKKCSELETQNSLLKGENKTLEEKLKSMLVSSEENVIFNNSVSSKSENLDLQKRIEKLITENEQLKNQNGQLKEDAERQKSAFSYTETKLEANYKELQNELSNLLKAKTELEENKNKQEAEYKSKFKALNEKLYHLQTNRQVLFQTKTSDFEESKEIKVSRADIFDAEEAVEKDVTELMEKLEVSQREKLELSLRLSSLSEQLKSKHSEICHLNEKVNSLKNEKEQIQAKCKELEVMISHDQKRNSGSNDPKTKYCRGKALKTAASSSESKNKPPSPRNNDEGINVRGNLSSGKDTNHEVTKSEEVQQMLKPEQQSLVEHLHGMTDGLTDETSLIAITQTEDNNLQQQVDTLKSEQNDLQLQMEAQRICLSLVYSAHVDQVHEYLKAEKESALSSLKEELVRSHLQQMNDLQRMHQLELQNLKIQQSDDEVKSTQRLIEKLKEAVTEECSRLAQVLCDSQNEHSSAAVEVGDREQDIFYRPAAMKEKLSVKLPTPRGQAQAVQEPVDALLRKIMEEYSRLKALKTQLMRDYKEVKEPWLSSSEKRKKEEPSHLETRRGCLQTPSLDLMDPKIQEYCSKEMGNLKIQLEEQHAREMEHLRFYFQQQLEESEERYTTEIVHLQDKLQSAGISSDPKSVSTDSERKLKEVFRKVKCTESLHQQRTDETLKHVSMENDSLVAERERMLLEELESLKQHSVPRKERAFCELQNNSTQTENENYNQSDVRVQIFEGEDGGRKPDETSSAFLSKERHGFQKANEKLVKILLEVVKTTVAMEETIGCHVLGLLDRSGKDQLSKSSGWDTETEESVKPCIHVGYEKESCSSYHGSVGDDGINIWSGAVDEGLLSQHLAESGVEIDPENEELVLNVSSRLQAAVEKLLEAINETSNQLEHAKITQTELMRESFKKQQEASEFIKYQEELQERLNEETKAREQLALELSKAESLIDGYADEKAFLEKQLQEKIDVIDHLEQELLCTGNKLQELEAEQQQIQEEKELLSRQKDAMRADAGPVEQRLVDAAVDAASQAELLEETEKLMKEKIEVQRQAEKEYGDLQKQVKVLEIDLEEQVNHLIELEQEKNAELMDLRQQNQALEKQLEKTRKFLDEQAIDREHERDIFQQEIQKLEQQLKVPQRSQPANEHQTREVEQLTNHLKEKTDKCSELLLSKEQLQRDIQERNEEIEKLECRVRELEQALIISADNLQKVEERKQFGTIIVKGELPLEVQLQAEREAVDRKEKEVTNLEEQLEQFREELENKNEEVQQLHMQLEIQRKESTTHLQELEQENKLFKDEMEILGLAIQKSEDATIKDHHLVAERLTHIMQEKEQEIDHLHEQIAKLQQQLEVTTDNKVNEEQNEHIRELEAQVEFLKSDQERMKKKNYEEVEQLNDVIDVLQQELANIEQKVPADIAAFQEDADSLKHTLETVLAEKEALEKQVENINVEASRTKNELEETKLKMKELKQEISMLKKEHERITEKYKSELMKGDGEKREYRCTGKSGKVEEGLSEKIELLDQSQLRFSDDNTRITISKMELQLQQLQASIKEKDSELCRSCSEIKDLREKSKAERERLTKRILEMEKTVMEKVAAALVSQVQLNAVQEQRKFMQEIQETSKCVEEASKNAPTEDLSDRAENEMETKLSLLTQRLSEVKDQLIMVNHNLELEKENVKVAKKEAKEKEGRLLELQQLLEEVQEKHKKEIQEYIRQEEMQTNQVEAQIMESQKENVLINELELQEVKEETAAAKEELSIYRAKAEKLQQELAVKEASLICLQEDLCKVKENLVQAEKKLASYVRKNREITNNESKKDAEIMCDLSTSESTLIRKSSSSQTDKTINSCIQISPVLVKNAEVQIDLQNACSSEDIAEIMREFTEKIDQMQELHAAEIMDMETRHISESEALKREKSVAVQVLTEECNTLKEVIETLQAKEGIPVSGLVRSPLYHARDRGSSDSSSDWSQGMYLAQTQGTDTISEGTDEGENSTDLLPKKIKGLLRAVHHEGIQVLSLTEFPYGEREMPPLKQEPESWHEERKAFLSVISSLKDLIAKLQLHRGAEICASTESPESVPDWRGELLHAIQQLFVREQNVLLAAFQTELAELGTQDAVILMNQVEHRLQEQATNQGAAMNCLQHADRRSLLMEIQVLHAQMNSKKSNPKREQQIDPKSQDDFCEMLEYSMQQKQSQILEMKVELRNMKDRAAELQVQLNSERMMGAELKNELAQAKLELEATLKAQHKHFKDLETIRTEVKEKAAELDILKDTMASEQKKSRELQWALEKEKAKMERSEEREREEFEDLKFSLEDQKQKNLQLTALLEQEKQLSTDLQQKIESQEALSAGQLSRERGRNSELQVLLESEKVRALEISSALEREKELCAQLQSAEDKWQAGTPNPSEELLKELQKQMDEKHDRVVELISEMEKYKLESVQVKQQMEKERQIQRKALQAEQDANIIAQKKLHELESKVEDLQWQLGEKKQEVHKLGNETKKLEKIIQELQKKEQENEGRNEAERTPSHNPNETTWDTPNDRTRNWVLQQKMEGAETNESTYSKLTGGDLSATTEILENVRQKLQNVFPKLKLLAQKAASRLQFEKADDQDFIAIQNAIEEVISELQKLPGLSGLEELKLVLPPGTPSSSLTERLLRQNAELTGFVSRLSEEKNNLRNAVMKLEEELRRYQHKQPSGDYPSRHSLDVGVNIDTLVASGRENWNREKLSLQKSLKQAEAELLKLRAELRSETFLRELGSNSENAVLRRIYGKYLRAESFRKALIYQKKYLLLLLGGFQECEEATLALIAQMGGQSSYIDLKVITWHSKGFTRFRSAVRVSIAISRMKFLVRRWHRVTGSGILNVNRDVSSQSTGNELRPDSFSGGVDLYGEQRHSYRSRFHGMHTDLNPAPFTSSQLQNYDPERALTDYINRLEALQKRLGSVQSGSTSYTQLHVGMRR